MDKSPEIKLIQRKGNQDDEAKYSSPFTMRSVFRY